MCGSGVCLGWERRQFYTKRHRVRRSTTRLCAVDHAREHEQFLREHMSSCICCVESTDVGSGHKDT